MRRRSPAFGGRCTMLLPLLMLLLSTTSAWPFSRSFNTRLSVEDALHERIERFRAQMPCGIDGGPPLAPYQQDEQDLTFDLAGFVNSTGMLRNLTVNDLDGFNVDYLEFSLFRLRLDYSVTLPIVRTSGWYTIIATIMDAFDIHGTGPFEFDLHNVNVNGFLRFRVSIRGELSIVEMESLVRIDSVGSRIQGILDSIEGSDFYNTMIELMLPDLIASNQHTINREASRLLMPLINAQLDGITLADLIGSDPEDELRVTCEPNVRA